ncbi:MAG: 2-oxo acid dehydrogenase subunit E2 [Planctomycetaceae bacterium]
MLDWPLKTPAVSESEIPILNSYYLKACPTPSDPTIVWGTEFDVTPRRAFLQSVNADSRVLVTGAHLLLKAVAQSLVHHPRLNRRVVRRRLYEFQHINILMPLQNRHSGEAEVILLKGVDRLSLAEISRQVWEHHRNTTARHRAHDFQKALFRRLPRPLVSSLLRFLLRFTNRFHRPITRLNQQLVGAAVLVNDFSHLRAPMRSYKPSRFPTDSWTLTITLGPAEDRPVVVDGQIRIRQMAPLFVRSDHRLVDGHELGQFVQTLRTILADPASLESNAVSSGGTAVRLPRRRRSIRPPGPTVKHRNRDQQRTQDRAPSAPVSKQA